MKSIVKLWVGLVVTLVACGPLALASASAEAVVQPLRLQVPVYREVSTHIHRPQGLKPGEKRPCILFVYPGKVGEFGCKMPAELSATQGLVTTHFSAADNLPAEFNAAGREGLGHAGQDAVYTLLKHLLSLPEVDKENVGIVTHSGGIVTATGALARHPDIQVKFLIDWEGPSGFQGSPPDKKYLGFQGPRGSPPDKKYAEERAASEFIKRIRCCYLRVQGEIDHAQRGMNNQHAIEMLNNAAGGTCPWTRCNNNKPNILYDEKHPENEKSKWFPGRLDPRETDKLIAGYIAEMIKMPPPKTGGGSTSAVIAPVFPTVGLADAARPLRADETKEPLPVYVYLFAHYEDHINIELSEWRIKEVMRILNDAHRAHPDRVAAVGEFYGADSEIFQQRNKESGIVDLIRRAVGAGWYDVGYHGAHEPIYAATARATRNLAGKNWPEIYTATHAFYTAHRDLKTGALDSSRKGGVALMQEVFGSATVLSAAAGMTDPPGLLALNDLTGCRVLFGFTDHGPAMFNRDYIPAVLEIRKAISPTPETSPDVFWFMGCLVTSSHPVSREIGVIGSELPAVAQKFERLDRTRVAVPHMIYGTKFIYARASPTEYAYAGPDRIPPQARAIRESRGDDFRLPPELLWPEAERKQKLENFRQNLDWLLTRYFPANTGSRCVGNRRLFDLTVPYAGDSISAAELERAVAGLLRDWTERPPNFASTGARYLTLAQTFKLLATALKSRPASIQTDMTYGPVGTWTEVVQGAEADVDSRAVIAAASQIVFGPERQRGDAKPPANRVPLNVTVAGQTMHAAQFLRLMAETYQGLCSGNVPGVLRVKRSDILPPLSSPWKRVHRVYEDTPAVYSYLQLWTVKPAQFKEAMRN